jgi:glycosidase
MQDLNIPNKEALDPVPHALKLPKWLGNLANETFNRDDVRTPMQWTNRKHAGFSDAEKTWLPVNPNHPTINVQSAQQDSTSLYYFFKKLNNVRNKNLSLSRKGNVLFLNGTILNFNKRKSVKVNGLKVEPLGVVWF